MFKRVYVTFLAICLSLFFTFDGYSEVKFLNTNKVTPSIGSLNIKAITSDGSTNIISGTDSDNVSRIKVDSNGATTITSDATSGFALSVVDGRSSGYSNILSFLAPNAPSGTVMQFGTDATHNSSWTWDRATSMMGYQTYGNLYPFEFQGSYSHFASVNGSKFLSGPTGAGGTEWARFDNGTLSLAVGTSDLDGTPAIGRITAKATTADGSTNILVGRDSNNANVFSVKSNGDLVNSGTLNSNVEKIPDDYGSDISTDGSFDSWVDINTPTSWTVFDYGGILERESVKVYAAPYSVKFTESEGQKVIGQLQTGLNSSYVYRARFYAATDNVGTGKMDLLFFDRTDLLTAKIWNFTTETWDTFSENPTEDQKYSVNLTADFVRYTSPSVEVPATNNILITYNGTGSPNDVNYLDETTFGTFVGQNQVTLFDFKNVSDGGDLGGLDYVFRFRDVNGSSLFGMTASGEFVTSSGVFDFSAEPLETGAVTSEGMTTLSTTGTATSGTTEYNSYPLSLKGSAWDTDNSVARTTEVRLTWEPYSFSTVGGILTFKHYIDGVASGSDFLRIDDAGGSTFYGPVRAGAFYSELFSADNGSVNLTGGLSSGPTAVAVVIDNEYELTHSGSKLLQVRNNEVEKLAVDYQGTLKTYGGKIVNVTEVNAATYDLLPTDDIVHVTYTSTGAVTSLTLPSAQAVDGRSFIVKDAGGNSAVNNITIDTEGSEKIDGEDTFVIDTNYGAVNIYAKGGHYFVY